MVIIHVSHLGGIDASTYMPAKYDPSKPTLVLCHSWGTSVDLYRYQYENEELMGMVNLLAIDLLGHGRTRLKSEHFTYWDSAIMNLQVLDALGINGKIFVLGTSQGGWQTVRMALLAPERVAGIIPLGTSLDAETSRSVELGCRDGIESLTPFIEDLQSVTDTPSFVPSDNFLELILRTGFNDIPDEHYDFWTRNLREVWSGDDGRRRARMCALNLRDRDGLHGRLFDIQCPVLRMHGTDDAIYSVRNAEAEMKLLVNAPKASLLVVEGGSHYLNYTHADHVNRAVVEFLKQYL
ncbi:hypothetical protein D0862_09125 [Hortaea werneckii]|uniref:AB hydrolase-1 domain-containing protein n=1 Tax=Hortaea werneckii TaxID=91943 RepID=A0A3M7FXY5_HORWE|nr:hypothetical protein D0862_09125 [Hortaea werneckii]